MSGFLSDATTGWSFECDTAPEEDPTSDVEHPPHGGLVLRDIRHRDNNFARSMRLIGMRLTVAEVDPSGAVTKRKSQFVLLDPATFTVGADPGVEPLAGERARGGGRPRELPRSAEGRPWRRCCS